MAIKQEQMSNTIWNTNIFDNSDLSHEDNVNKETIFVFSNI